jgi:hypothetical protein
LTKPKKKWGLIDKTGKLIIPTEWDNLDVFSDKIICAKRGDLWRFINLAGKQVGEFKWNELITGHRDGFSSTGYLLLAQKISRTRASITWVDGRLKEIWSSEVPVTDEE